MTIQQNLRLMLIVFCLSTMFSLAVSAQDDIADSPAECVTGGEIVFVSDREGNTDIYRMDTDGDNIVNLTQDPADDYSPRWSPDGTQIAFASTRAGAADIYVMDADGGNVQRLTFNDEYGDDFPIWSADGTQIAYTSYASGDGDIYVIDADGVNPRQIIATGGVGYASAWSPDGALFAYEVQTTSDFEMYMTDDTVNFSSAVQLSDNTTQDFGFNWSPDGKLVAFNYGIGDGGLYLMRASEDYTLENNPLVLITDQSDNSSVPAWSSDNAWIVYSSALSGAEEIYLVNLDGSDLTNLTESATSNDYYPDWRPCVPVEVR